MAYKKPFNPHAPRKKTGGRKLGTKNRATVEKEMRAEIALMERTGVKLAKDRLSEVMNYFGALVDYYAPMFDGATGKLLNKTGDMRKLREAADMVTRAGSVLIAYQSPRLTAVGVGLMGEPTAPIAATQQPRRVRISIDIFGSTGELADHSGQGDVRLDDVPLLVNGNEQR